MYSREKSQKPKAGYLKTNKINKPLAKFDQEKEKR